MDFSAKKRKRQAAFLASWTMNDSLNAPFRLLFVCMGNICRSPAAEIIFHQLAREAGLEEAFEIDSAGTLGYHRGSPPDPRMAEVLQRKGYAVRGRSRPIHPDDLAAFDLIVTMDEDNLAEVKRLDANGAWHAKIRPFVSYCRTQNVPRVPDPYAGNARGFEQVVELLEDGCRGMLAELSGTMSRSGTSLASDDPARRAGQ